MIFLDTNVVSETLRRAPNEAVMACECSAMDDSPMTASSVTTSSLHGPGPPVRSGQDGNQPLSDDDGMSAMSSAMVCLCCWSAGCGLAVSLFMTARLVSKKPG